MTSVFYLEIVRVAAPEIVVVLAALAVLTIDLFVTREMEPGLRVSICAMFAAAGCAVAIAWIFAFPHDANIGPGMLVSNGLTGIVKASILVLSLLTVLLVPAALRPASQESPWQPGTAPMPHVGEHFALVLLSTVGMLLLISARDLLMVFLCLELSTVPLYVLAAFDKGRKESVECGLKFFLFGAVSTALTLFGFSLLYGLGGSSNLAEVARGLSGWSADPLVIAAIVLVIAGIGFKVAAAPFHLWAPDVYEAAPAVVAAFIGSASKVAGFFVLGVVLVLGLGIAVPGERTAGSGWLITIGTVAGFSMILGNLAAIVQTNVRRLLAFSAVGHAGYMLLALLSGDQTGFAALVFYAVTYGLSALGALAIAGLVQGASNSHLNSNLNLNLAPNLNPDLKPTSSCEIGDFAGLASRSPALAICMFVFMLSLAGIPPFAGFIAKFYVFATLLDPGPEIGWRLGLLFLAVGTSAVSLYYYLKVLKSIYVTAPSGSTGVPEVSPVTVLLLVFVAGSVLGLGCYPEALLGPLIRAVAVTGL
jgi:NADH-quinone oxidoreductase subunit N